MIPISFLLVDDEKPFIETLAQRLRQRGSTVSCAFSGMEAEQAVFRRNERKAKIFDIRIKLYITQEERDEQIAQVLKS